MLLLLPRWLKVTECFCAAVVAVAAELLLLLMLVQHLLYGSWLSLGQLLDVVAAVAAVAAAANPFGSKPTRAKNN